MKNKRQTFLKKVHYHLDDYISKGFLAQIILLVAVAAVLILIFGIILKIVGAEASVSDGIWESLMHVIDQGTITGEDDRSSDFLQIMLILTFIGMAFTSTIIAIINSAIEEKMYEMRKGHSAVIEKNHVVLMGFNENTFTISREITEAGRRRLLLKDRLVIVDDIPKEEMEHETKEFQESYQQYFELSEEEKKQNKKSKVILRSGDLISENTFEMCAVEKARAIIINRENDLETVRILLALSAYLKKNKAYITDDRMPSIVAMIHNEENLAAAKTAAGILHKKGITEKKKNEHKVRILYYKDILASLFGQACIHPGIPFVMDSLFNSHAACICVEEAKKEGEEEESEFLGKNLPEIREMLTEGIPLGFMRTDERKQLHVHLNPKDESTYQENDRLVYLAHRNALKTGERKEIELIGTPAEKITEAVRSLRHFLLIGWTDALPGLVGNIKDYCLEGSSVDIVAEEPEESIDGTSFSINCSIHNCAEPYRFIKLKKVLDSHPYWFDEKDERHLTNIIILSNDGELKAEADEKITVLLLNLRQYLQERGNSSIGVTSEMYLPKDQILLQNNSGNDFIIASEISNRMLVQIAGDPRKYYVMEELLKQRGAQLSLKPASAYCDPAEPFNFAFIFREAENREKEGEKREIPMGWIVLPDAPKDEDETSEVPMLVLAPSVEELAEKREDGYLNQPERAERYRLVIMTEGTEQM